MAGRVEHIRVAAKGSEPTFAVEEIGAVAGRGLEGDRNFHHGELPAPGDGENITLIEAEAIEGLLEDTGIDLGPGGSRRNIVTRGIGLNDLVGRTFRVGEVECRGVELCEPCRHLERLTENGVIKGLVHRGGLRADLLTSGRIAVGDEVAAAGELAAETASG